MDDEFLIYLREKIDDRLVANLDHTDILLWGVRSNDSVKCLGLTVNIGVNNLKDFNPSAEKSIISIMKQAYKLSEKCEVTFFAIVYSLSGEPSFLATDPDDPLNWANIHHIKENKMPEFIQTAFGTKLSSIGTAKAVNKSTSDWFQVWARENLPTEYVRLNIDGLLLDSDNNARIFLETKRSFYQVGSWKPFKDDARNYYLQKSFAEISDLEFWTVYHKKGITVQDDTPVALFIISNVSLKPIFDWITYKRLDIKAAEVIGLIDKE